MRWRGHPLPIRQMPRHRTGFWPRSASKPVAVSIEPCNATRPTYVNASFFRMVYMHHVGKLLSGTSQVRHLFRRLLETSDIIANYVQLPVPFSVPISTDFLRSLWEVTQIISPPTRFRAAERMPRSRAAFLDAVFLEGNCSIAFLRPFYPRTKCVGWLSLLY